MLHPGSEHILDWFHIAMRIEQLSQAAREVRDEDEVITKAEILRELDRTKWFLWHGNVVRANDTLTALIDDIDRAREESRQSGRPPQVALRTLSRALNEFDTYIDGNAGTILNYGSSIRPPSPGPACLSPKVCGAKAASRSVQKLNHVVEGLGLRRNG
jgi:hypothetical protein